MPRLLPGTRPALLLLVAFLFKQSSSAPRPVFKLILMTYNETLDDIPVRTLPCHGNEGETVSWLTTDPRHLQGSTKTTSLETLLAGEPYLRYQITEDRINDSNASLTLRGGIEGLMPKRFICEIAKNGTVQKQIWYDVIVVTSSPAAHIILNHNRAQIEVAHGSNASVDCELSSSFGVMPLLRWSRVLSETENIEIGIHFSGSSSTTKNVFVKPREEGRVTKLNINNAARENTGNYSCCPDLGEGRCNRKYVQIIVVEPGFPPARFQSPAENNSTYYATDSTSTMPIEVPCKVSNVTKMYAKVEWTYNGEALRRDVTASMPYQEIVSPLEATLFISPAVLEDTRVYTCVVSSKRFAQRKTRDVILSVARPTKSSSNSLILKASIAAGVGVVLLVSAGLLCLCKRKRDARLSTLENAWGWEAVENDPWQIKSENLEIFDVIDRGHMGIVYVGSFCGENQPRQKVAVKTMLRRKESRFRSEAMIMRKLSKEEAHQYVVQTFGHCMKEGYGYCLVLEYAEHGSLLSYLNSLKTALPEASLLHFTVASYGMQIAEAMSYLEKNHIIHRDLAARNVLVFEDEKLKLSDFGLSKDIEDLEYYKSVSGHELLPLRWMAPESMTELKFTHRSDTWSFGIVLWEIASMGGKPYRSVAALDLVQKLQSGHTLQKPEKCCRQLYSLMKECWNLEPGERPDFATLAVRLNKIKDERQSRRESLRLQRSVSSGYASNCGESPTVEDKTVTSTSV